MYNAGEPGSSPGLGRFPWRRKWQPNPVLLPGKSHGQRSLVGYSLWSREESDMTERLHFHFTFTQARDEVRDNPSVALIEHADYQFPCNLEPPPSHHPHPPTFHITNLPHSIFLPSLALKEPRPPPPTPPTFSSLLQPGHAHFPHCTLLPSVSIDTGI